MTKITTATPGGDCPTWRRFLDEVTGGDVELQAYLQRMVGYALTGSTQSTPCSSCTERARTASRCS